MRLVIAMFSVGFLLSHIGCVRDGNRPRALAQGEQLKLRVFYIRHGLSCGNVSSILAELTLKDPQLTAQGLENSRLAGIKFQEYLTREKISLDLVGSSALMRAKQTLVEMLPQQIRAQQGNLFEMGYLGERTDLVPVAWQTSNMPEDVAIQQQKLASKFSHLAPLNINPRYLGEGPRDDANYEAFQRRILPKILKDLRANNVKSDYNIAIVTHSLTMKNEIKCVRNPGDIFPEKPYNNEVYYIDYVYQLDEPLTQLSESTCYQAVELAESREGPNDQASCQLVAVN